MQNTDRSSVGFSIVGLVFLLIGVGVFAIRLTHAGTYVLPHGAAFIGGLLLLPLGIFLLWPKSKAIFRWLAIAFATIAALPSIYSIAGESQEVISLYVTDSTGAETDLRLWIVDRDDGAWVGMGRDKAVNHSLAGARLNMLRNGAMNCVIPALYEDRPTVSVIHEMKVAKYKTAQIAGAIGLYPLTAGPSTVALRLDPC